jgi:hypothetical protein
MIITMEQDNQITSNNLLKEANMVVVHHLHHPVVSMQEEINLHHLEIRNMSVCHLREELHNMGNHHQADKEDMINHHQVVRDISSNHHKAVQEVTINHLQEDINSHHQAVKDISSNLLKVAKAAMVAHHQVVKDISSNLLKVVKAATVVHLQEELTKEVLHLPKLTKAIQVKKTNTKRA